MKSVLLLLEHARVPEIVLIQECNQVAFGGEKSGVPGCGASLVGLSDDPHTRAE
jgi:hypothetical protein